MSEGMIVVTDVTVQKIPTTETRLPIYKKKGEALAIVEVPDPPATPDKADLSKDGWCTTVAPTTQFSDHSHSPSVEVMYPFGSTGMRLHREVKELLAKKEITGWRWPKKKN